MRYNRKHLTKLVSIIAKVKYDDAKTITGYTLKALREFIIGMKVGDILQIRGLGVFTVHLYRGRLNVRNPKTGERAIMSSRRRLRFVISRTIKSEYRKVI